MRFSVLASGSKGNVTFLEHENTRILIDAGMSTKYIVEKLVNLNINPNTIDAIFITHGHSDHVKGLKSFVGKYNTKVYITNKMYEEVIPYVDDDNLVYIKQSMQFKDFHFRTFRTSHDSADSVGFIINDELVYITDTGYLKEELFDEIKNKKTYIMESNHDVEMVLNCSYPFQTKKRILSDKGHLSNKESSRCLSIVIGNNTKNVVLIHLSEENNDGAIALTELSSALVNRNKEVPYVTISSQNEMTEMIEV